MPQVHFPNYRLASHDLFGDSNEQTARLQECNALDCAGTLLPNMPYCVEQHPQGRCITKVLSDVPEAPRQQLGCMAEHFGDFTSALAALYDKHLGDLDLQQTAGFVGAGATASQARFTGFQKALGIIKRHSTGCTSTGEWAVVQALRKLS